MEEKLKNLTFLVVLGFCITYALIIGLYFNNGTTSTNNGGSTGGENTSTTEYDVSKMKQVSGSDAAKLFDEKGTHIIYIGRPTCHICVSLVPELNSVIDDYKLDVNYLQLEGTFKTDFKDLFKHLTIKTEVNDEKGTFGELLEKHGYTPMVIIVKDGKMVDGFIGYRDEATISKIFKKYI